MMAEFRKFAGNKILDWLLMHPTTPVSINELARILSVSPATVLRYVNLLENNGLVFRKPAGTAHQIFLNQDSPLVLPLKKSAALLRLWDAGIRKIAPAAISVAVYGSIASGAFDEKSDLDLLILGEEPDVDRAQVIALQEEMERQVQLTVLPWHQFETLKGNHDPFLKSVLANHVLIHGVPL
ncbi:MAG: nucleotidyltransferase domain-containing protein [Methanoregulaceae archaeon]